MKNQKGFSLVELLVVVIIIAIIAAIAIPSLLASRRAANEASAISSLRTINSAQATFFATKGANKAYATSLTVLGPTDQKLIDGALAGATGTSTAKSGYVFKLTTDTGATVPNGNFCAAADAATQDTSGTRSFGVANPGVIQEWPGAGASAACADGVLGSGGTAIQ